MFFSRTTCRVYVCFPLPLCTLLLFPSSMPQFLRPICHSSLLPIRSLFPRVVRARGRFDEAPKKKKVVRSRANADRTSAFSFCACAYILDMRPIQPVLHVIGLVDSNLPSLAKLSCVTEILDFMAVVPITQSNRRACDPGSLPHIFFLSVSRSNLEPCVLPCVFCA